MSIYNPIIPYCDRIQYPINSGTLIRIQGTPHPSSRCFAINLQCGPSVNPRDDIALHLSPVFSPPPRVVRNSLQMQRWGPEESFGGFPFVGGQPFEVMILLDFDQIKIAINGSHFTEFRYRIPMNRITHLSIDGEVSITSINFEGTAQPSYSAPSAPPAAGLPPYPMGGGAMQMPGAYAPSPAYATGAPYPPQASYGNPTYPTGGYPPQQQQYPTAGYPNPGYPGSGYPPTAYPHSPQSQNKGIFGGALGGTLGGLAAGAAATSIGSAILGKGMGHKIPGMGPQIPGMGHKIPGMGHKSSPIPIGGLVAGAGAAALGAAVLTGHHPFKKAKKLFKHKGFKHKGWHKPKFGKWKHKGWSSSSSSD